MSDIEKRAKRDNKNALQSKEKAIDKLNEPAPKYCFSQSIAEHRLKESQSLRSIASNAFQAMVEVEIETRDGSIKEQLLYSNLDTKNNIILSGSDGNSININVWTHPAIQIGLTENLAETHDISSGRYSIVSVRPLARARFNQVIPAIIGIYEPGGSIGEYAKMPAQAGLKAVKLDMTQEQVMAFLSKMDGVMLVMGAPGSGKTTVAFQRIRFLFDQQELREQTPGLVDYTPETTRIFLSNRNLVAYSKDLLEKNLSIPSYVVELVPEFIGTYISYAWTYKGGAKPSQKKSVYPINTRAREAFFSLCTDSDLKGCWGEFKKQIARRLLKADKADWYNTWVNNDNQLQGRVHKLAEALITIGKSYLPDPSGETDPSQSSLRMDSIYDKCGPFYEQIREDIKSKKEKERFEEDFSKWLFHVYDPIDCLKAYFKTKRHEGGLRIKHGTASRVDENSIIEEIFSDWKERAYRTEEAAWIAWLLRFSLPEETDPQKRFRRIRSSILDGWINHIVIDEAQDLSVVEASLLASFVHPRGALTISADFHQVVSPVHGMEDSLAFKYGCPIRDRASDMTFPFTKNMRQTKQITEFLRAFYSNVFKQPPPFIPADEFEDIVPQLHICKPREISKRINNIYAVLKKAKKTYSIALIQINEDENELMRLRDSLESEGVPLAPVWEPFDSKGALVTSSVERIKGLEYDICFIVGMDDIEKSSLKHTINRSYVAISRPMRRLVLFCERFPKLLQGIDETLYNIV